jgi:hypothetical protein
LTSDSKSLALQALKDFCEPGSFGDFASEKEISKNHIEVQFHSALPAYNNWLWTVVLTRVDKKSPFTISEIVLVAGEDALLAPPWTPWAERLAEFRKQLREEGRAATDAEADAIIQGLTGGEPSEPKAPPKVRVRQRRIRVVEEGSVPANDEQSDKAQGDSDTASAEPKTKVRTRKPRVEKKKEKSGKPKADSDK